MCIQISIWVLLPICIAYFGLKVVKLLLRNSIFCYSKCDFNWIKCISEVFVKDRNAFECTVIDASMRMEPLDTYIWLYDIRSHIKNIRLLCSHWIVWSESYHPSGFMSLRLVWNVFDCDRFDGIIEKINSISSMPIYIIDCKFERYQRRQIKYII